MVSAFTPNRPDDALDIRILPRRTRCDENWLDPKSVAVEVLTGDVLKWRKTGQLPKPKYRSAR